MYWKHRETRGLWRLLLLRHQLCSILILSLIKFEWLEDGEGDPTPTASSTLWVIELNGTLDRDGREEVAQQIRTHLNSDGVLTYHMG